jgi:uncharacterized protein
MIKRTVTDKLIRELFKDNILILIGARQVGKTTLLRYTENYLINHSEQVSFFSLEDRELLADLNIHPKNIFKYIDAQNQYLLIDEIQYLADPSNFLKYIYDLHSDKIKLVVTGSSAFYIDRKFKDSLAGRKKIINIHPFSFSEFLLAKNEQQLAEKISSHQFWDNFEKLQIIKPQMDRVYLLFNEYFTYGGYPKIVLEQDKKEKVAMLRELHLSFLRKDILESGIKNESKFYALLKILAYQTGELVNINELSSTLQLSRDAINNYIYIMEKSFILKLVRPFFNNIRKELSKMSKVYFFDTGFRNSIMNTFESLELRIDKGSSLENIFFTELQCSDIEEINYWRTADKNEVDFIINRKYAFEIKFNQEKLIPSKYKTFKKKYPDIPFYGVSYYCNEKFSIIDFLN